MNSAFNTAVIYILHITDREGKTSQLGGRYSSGHYTGKAADIKTRLGEHRGGSKQSVITRECMLRGLDFKLARVIIVPKQDASKCERALKNCKIKRDHCPVCRIEREQQKLEVLNTLPVSRYIKQKITKARRAILRAKELLREAQAIGHLVGSASGWKENLIGQGDE